MSSKLASRAALSMLAMSVALSAQTVPASAERYLFDILFGRRAPQAAEEPVQRRVPNRARQSRPANVVPLPKISGPTYYDYRPEQLVNVDFAAIASALISGEGEESSRAFRAALDDFRFELSAEKDISKALITYYSKHPSFIWIDDQGLNKRADAVLDVLANTSEYGLNDADYAVSVPLPASSSLDEPDARAKSLLRFEMTLSARALRYARDAHHGRIDPNGLSGYHDFDEKKFAEERVLRALANTPRPEAYLKALHPRNDIYAALVNELKVLRASEEKEIVVAPDTFIRPGSSHPEFPKILRIIERDADETFLAKHGGLLASFAGSETYDYDLVPVIKAAQHMHDLNPDGVIGRQTVGALAGESRQARIDKVLLALERLRWHPSYLGSRRVEINAASFTATYVDGDEERLSMRAVVGSKANQTNFFHDKIEYVEFNPYWGVPRSILVNEKLPRLRRDPGYLDRAGYEVTNSSGRRISSASINWSRYGANIPFNVRQKPGPNNALGQLKIMFPNKHNIYMHDTPAKELFERDTRAYSHGCVRLQDPAAMAAAVLSSSTEDVEGEIATGRNHRRDVPEEIPVYVGYFTAWPDASGNVQYYPDTYERDDRLAKALAKVREVRSPGS